MTGRTLDIETPHGTARAHLDPAAKAPAAMVLGHGAGGGVEAPDLVAARAGAREAGLTVVRVEQPYRVAGRRSPPRAAQLDAAWMAVVEQLRSDAIGGVPLVAGGRSMGARVACRTSGALGAVAVVCLAFPLAPPQRAGKPPQSRIEELDSVAVPTLVVQGDRDRFGMPPAAPSRRVVQVTGDHGLKSDLPAVADAVASWLAETVIPRIEAG